MNKRKVGFVLCSNSANPIPSTRIAVLNMLPFLHAANFQTCILFEPSQPTESPDLSGVLKRAVEDGCGIVVLQKVSGSGAVELAKSLREVGVKTVFSVCDRVDLQMAEATDLTIVISDFLKSLYPQDLQKRICVVHDGIENPNVVKKDWGRGGTSIKALLVTSQDLDYLPVINSTPSWLHVRIMGRYKSGVGRLRDISWKIRSKGVKGKLGYLSFLMNRQISCVPWGQQEVYRELLDSDIGIIPISSTFDYTPDGLPPEWLRKSENRLTLKMSVGLPVIATPIPSYEAIIDQGRNGYLARTSSDWSMHLNSLRDPALRKEIGLAARSSVENKYSMVNQASRFIDAIKCLS